ncbi:MAG: NAD(P)-dependent oxidoreductase [Candidatus Eremiobacteraeota bacterium]|nr:NAD(P)-dependent oxidoreductase [Candidatus Eremiobacteraeota bacterium]MBV9056063.1 NAD(P)-dependent oxidoreductase [Candidatus Eremiobacteraeota bacterium]MBV9699524.1 NAD(P)-dependent oxidoreductase [Candidatus Eremiobacteraeota bacterium]
METIAFYGAGMLGSAMVRNLLRHGFAVNVWNRTPERAKALEENGARAFADPAQAAAGAQSVHLCLSDDAAVDSVINAALGGVATAAPIVDHTTAAPNGVAERARRLAEAGYAFVHAPVFMGPPMADEATGVMLVSGDRATVQRVRPTLEMMCSDLRDLGERPDAAAIFKLMGNAMILAVVGGLNDCLRIAEEQGLSREHAYALFDFYDPSGQIKGRGKRMVAENYEPFWTIDMAHKDAVLMQGAAHHERLPVVDALAALTRDVSGRGLGELDLAAVAQR